MNNIIKLVCWLLCAVFIFGTIGSSYAIGQNKNTEIIVNEGSIDPYIYEMVDKYYEGIFVERNESQTLTAGGLFNSVGMQKIQGNEEISVDYIYDIKNVGENAFEATRVAIVSSLEQESQGEQHDVVIFSRIVYLQKYFGEEAQYVMLTKVKGGIVQNNENYWCENIKLGYEVKGDAYDANHNRYGWKSAEYISGSVYSPNVGSTYSIDGPSDYYYCMGVAGSAIVGYNYGTISRRLGESTHLTVPSAITSIW